MKLLSNTKSTIAAICGLLIGSAALASGAAISVNFSSDREDAAILGGESAGAPGYTTTGWNNFDGIPSDVTEDTVRSTADINSPNAGQLTADNGVIQAGTTIEWHSRNAWNTDNGVTNPDNKLMNGYIDNNADSPQTEISILGLSSAFTGPGYSVVAYVGSDGNDRTGTIGVTGGDTFSYSTFSAQAGGFPDSYVLTTDTADGNPQANYAVWSGLNGADFTITLDRGSSNSGVHGFQIIAVPEPSTGLLLGLAGLALVVRRRR